MTITAIDPGTTESAILRWNGERVCGAAIVGNETLLQYLRAQTPPVLAVEGLACFGMPVGKEVFETAMLIGRIQEIAARASAECRLVYRMTVKQHHCHNGTAKDANIRQALIDKYGAPGTKKHPGLTFGITSHLWSAFAIATYVTETTGEFRLR